ncbi:MAG: molybdenum cofactor guanylyltransferase [Conexivisphaerales archaeon]
MSKLAVAILAGGKSSRMGMDKAFLKIKDSYFIQIIAKELTSIAGSMVAVIGEKSPEIFTEVLEKNIIAIKDNYKLANPMGGMMTAFDYFDKKEDYVAIVACDLPLVKKELILRLHDIAVGHDAAVPVWDNGDLEPLCAVYSVKKGLESGKKMLQSGIIGCRNLVKAMNDVRYVAAEELKDVDKELSSFRNINTKKDYEQLVAKIQKSPKL